MENKYNIQEVKQGNGQGLVASNKSNTILYTSDLGPCIAVVLISENDNYMIHSDANDESGAGSISFADGLKKLLPDLNLNFNVSLFGGTTIDSINKKIENIKKILPNSKIITKNLGQESIYLSADGITFQMKSELKKYLEIKSLPENSLHNLNPSRTKL